MPAEHCAWRISDLEVLDESGVMQTTAVDVADGLAAQLQLALIEVNGFGKGLVFALFGQTDLLLEMIDRFLKRKIQGKLDETNEISAGTAAVAVEEILGCVYIEGWSALRMQRTQTDEFLAIADRPGGPVQPREILQQRHTLFERLHVDTHGCFYLRGPVGFQR